MHVKPHRKYKPPLDQIHNFLYGFKQQQHLGINSFYKLGKLLLCTKGLKNTKSSRESKELKILCFGKQVGPVMVSNGD